MRAASRWNRPRWLAIRALRRLEILVSPVLGSAAYVVALLVGWFLLVVLAVAGISFYVASLLLERKDRRLPGPARDCVYVKGKTVREIANAVSVDRRFQTRSTQGGGRT